MIFKTISRLLLAVLIFTTFGCPQDTPTTLPATTEGGGFIEETLLSVNGSPTAPAPGVELQGNWLKDYAGAAGDATEIQGLAGLSSFNPPGLILLPGKRAPARWRWLWISGGNSLCSVPPAFTIDLDVNVNEIQGIECVINSGGVFGAAPGSFTFSPNPVFTYSPPSSGTITGSGIKSTYGMPLVQYYAMNGTLVAQENATYVSPTGTSLAIAGGNISSLQPGAYAGYINNMNSNGTYSYVGTADVQVNGPINLGSCVVGYRYCGYQFFSPVVCQGCYSVANLGHPYATITNTYVTSGDASQFSVQMSMQYNPYPTLVNMSYVSLRPKQAGTFSIMVHIDLSDGASFNFMFVGTGTT